MLFRSVSQSRYVVVFMLGGMNDSCCVGIMLLYVNVSSVVIVSMELVVLSVCCGMIPSREVFTFGGGCV